MAIRSAMLFSGVLLMVAGAQAQTHTEVNPLGGGSGNERCLVGDAAGICQGGAYDGASSILHVMEMDLGLETGSLLRVDDTLDQVWQSTVSNGGQVLTRARYASHTLELGFDAGDGYVPLTNNIGNQTLAVSDMYLPMLAAEMGYGDSFVEVDPEASGSWTAIQPLDAFTLFAFVLYDYNNGQYWSSNNSTSGVGSGFDNPVDDHMVTFMVDATHYFIAFEDLPLGSSDTDYNDMVLEVMFVQPVPVPAALPLLLSGLFGFGLLRRRCRR